jgi:Ni/Co efflux regulator RcnB
MKPLIFTTLALSLLLLPAAMAQVSHTATNAQPDSNPASNVAAISRNETTGGDKKNPDPHIYKMGEHLSELYGRYDLVDDWGRRQLKKPPEGHHWVRYGDNYLLVKITDGLITDISHAS